MTITEALEKIKSILEDCPMALSKMQPFIKELRKEFRDKGQYYGHGGARIRCNSSKESSSSKLNLKSDDSKSQQIKTKLETENKISLQTEKEEEEEEEYDPWYSDVYNVFFNLESMKWYRKRYKKDLRLFEKAYTEWCKKTNREISQEEMHRLFDEYHIKDTPITED